VRPKLPTSKAECCTRHLPLRYWTPCCGLGDDGLGSDWGAAKLRPHCLGSAAAMRDGNRSVVRAGRVSRVRTCLLVKMQTLNSKIVFCLGVEEWECGSLDDHFPACPQNSPSSQMSCSGYSYSCSNRRDACTSGRLRSAVAQLPVRVRQSVINQRAARSTRRHEHGVVLFRALTASCLRCKHPTARLKLRVI
jgi:hypothetical protein